jgi:hypothetical protein
MRYFQILIIGFFFACNVDNSEKIPSEVYQTMTKDGSSITLVVKNISDTIKKMVFVYKNVDGKIVRDSSCIFYLKNNRLVSYYGDESNLSWLIHLPKNLYKWDGVLDKKGEILLVAGTSFSRVGSKSSDIQGLDNQVLSVRHNNNFYRVREKMRSEKVALYSGPCQFEIVRVVDMPFFAGPEVVTNSNNYLDVSKDSVYYNLVGFGDTDSLDVQRYQRMYFVKVNDFDRIFEEF